MLSHPFAAPPTMVSTVVPTCWSYVVASTVDSAGNKVVMVVTILSHAAEVKVSTVVPSSHAIQVVKFTVLVTSGTKVVTVVTMLSHPFVAPPTMVSTVVPTC
ncbi:MAG: hypothetical protein R2728_06645 [Chitinophagales bacterium]